MTKLFGVTLSTLSPLTLCHCLRHSYLLETNRLQAIGYIGYIQCRALFRIIQLARLLLNQSVPVLVQYLLLTRLKALRLIRYTSPRKSFNSSMCARALLMKAVEILTLSCPYENESKNIGCRGTKQVHVILCFATFINGKHIQINCYNKAAF